MQEARPLLDPENYNRFRVSPRDPMTLRCEDVKRHLKKLADGAAGRLHVSKFAESLEGRPIYLATIGSGPRRVLLWSQMHGDEPTHTAVLLDLMSYLLKFPDEAAAAEVLSGTTLYMLPLLNPDGAERHVRNNAQDIDINRDARRLATPEGRALQRAVETLQPEFGFNLHNQNARTSVGAPARPAVVSVLAPPVDYDDPQTEQIQNAKRVAATVVEAMRPEADGMMSRYAADYMPRAFGESIQTSGVTTVLIEVGGWPEPDPSPLVELHFHGLVAALRAIATGRYRDVDVSLYDRLPRSNQHALVDCLITAAHVVDDAVKEPYQVDLAINHAHGHRLAIGRKPEGRIVEIGDIGVTSGKVTIDAAGSLVLPGRLAYLPEVAPGALPPTGQWDELLAEGITTVLGRVDLADRAALESIGARDDLPVNVGYVALVAGAAMLPAAELVDRLLFAVSQGVLAVVGDPPQVPVQRYLDWLGVPVLKPGELPPRRSKAQSLAELLRESPAFHQRLGLDNHRGKFRRHVFADCQFFAVDDPARLPDSLDGRTLVRVMVAGETVWERGQRTGKNPGMLLRNRTTTDGG